MTITFRSTYRLAALMLLLAALLAGQTSSSNILGTILDTGKTAVASAIVQFKGVPGQAIVRIQAAGLAPSSAVIQIT